MKTIACVNLNNKEIFESSVKFGIYSGFKDIINEIYSKKGFDHVIKDSDIEEHINLKKTQIYKDWETNKSKIISNLKYFIQKRDFRDDIYGVRNYYNSAITVFGEENVSMITSSLNVQTVIIAQPDIKKEILTKISEDEYNFLKESFPGTNDAKLYFVAEKIKEHNVKPRVDSNFYVKKQKFSFHNGQRSGSGKIGTLNFDDSIKLILNVFFSDLEFYNIIDGTLDYNISNYDQFTENVISSLKDGRLFKDDNQILMAKEFVYAFIRNEIQIGEDISSIDSELLESFLFNLYSENGDVISQEESQKKREEDKNIFLDKYKFLVDGVRNLSGKGSSVAEFFEKNAYHARAIEYFDFKTLIDYINKDAFRNSQTQIKYLKEFEEIDKSVPNSTKMAALDTIIQSIKNAVFENKRTLFDNGINPEEDYSFEDIYERFCEKTGLTEFFYNKIKNLTKQLDIRVKFATEFSSSQYYGQFFATNTSRENAGKINISSIAFESKQIFSETLIHETLHGLSIRIISAVSSGKIDGLTPLQIKGAKNIIKIYNEIKNDPNIPRKYVVSDVLEFVAALTEKGFYDYLKSKDKSIIAKIKEFFANLFNIDINQDPYIYKQTIKNLDRLIGDGSYLIKNGIVTDSKDYNTIFDKPELVYKKKDGSKIFPEKEIQEKETESSFQSNDIIWKKVDSFGKTIKEKQTQNQQTESTLSNSNQIKQGVVELFEENPKLANEVYKALGLNNINESEITYTDEEGNLCAKMGGRSSKFTKGSKWEIVKDLGSPKFKKGGIWKLYE